MSAKERPPRRPPRCREAPAFALRFALGTSFLLSVAAGASPAAAQNLCAAGLDRAAAWDSREQAWIELELPGAGGRVLESRGNCAALGDGIAAAWNANAQSWSTTALAGTPQRSLFCDPSEGNGAPGCIPKLLASAGSFAVGGESDVAIWDTELASWKHLGEAADQLVAGSEGSFAATTATAAAVYSPTAGEWRRRPAFFSIASGDDVAASGANFIFRTVPGFAEVITWDEAEGGFEQLLLPSAPALFEIRGSQGAVGYTFIGTLGATLIGVRDASGVWTALPLAPLKTIFEDGTLAFRSADGDGVQTAHVWTPESGFVTTPSDIASPVILSQGQFARRADRDGALLASPLSALAWNPGKADFEELPLSSPGSITNAIAPRSSASRGNFAVASFDGRVATWNRGVAEWSSSLQLHCVSVFPSTLGWRLAASEGNLLASDECETAAWSPATSEWTSIPIPGFSFEAPVSLLDAAVASAGHFAVASDGEAAAWHSDTRNWSPLSLPGAGNEDVIASQGRFLVRGSSASSVWSPALESWATTASGALRAVAASAGNFAIANAGRVRVWDDSEGEWGEHPTIRGSRAAAGSDGHFVLLSATRASAWSDFSRNWSSQKIIDPARIAGSEGNFAVAGASEVVAFHERSESWSRLELANASVEPRLRVIEAPEPARAALACVALAVLLVLHRGAGTRQRSKQSRPPERAALRSGRLPIP